MNSIVDGQSRTLDELLVAAREFTDMGSDTTVNTLYNQLAQELL